MVKFKTLVAEVGLAVGAALGGLQRLRRLTEATHDGDAAQAQCVSVPEGRTCVQRDKCRVGGREKKKKKALKTRERRLFSSVLALNPSASWPGYVGSSQQRHTFSSGGGKRLQPLPG